MRVIKPAKIIQEEKVEKEFTCPKCGAVMSPYQSYCVKCSGNWEITYSTGNAPQVGFYQVESNYNREQRESRD